MRTGKATRDTNLMVLRYGPAYRIVIVGGIIFTALGETGVTGFNLWSMFVAVIGAIVVLVLYHAIFGRRVD